jgi:hypothetical protein
MTKEPTIRFVEKSDLEDLVRLCELHAIFEKSDYDSKTGNKFNCYLKHHFLS